VLRVHAGDDGILDPCPAHDGTDEGILSRILLGFHRRGLQKPGDHGGQHLHMADLLGADIHEHVAIFLRTPAVPALEQIGHHHADLAPLPAKGLLQHLGEVRIGLFRLGVIRHLLLTEEHRLLLYGGLSGDPQPRKSQPSNRSDSWLFPN
jgi:hypothetical protein